MVNKLTLSTVFLILMAVAQVADAEVNTYVNQKEVYQGQPIKFVIDVSNISANAKIDISNLEQNFSVVGSSQQSSTSIINGKTSKRNEIVLSLLSKSLGTVKIPSISIDNEQTKTHTVTILAQTGQRNSAQDKGISSKDIYLTANVSDESPYVQQPLIYTAKLYRKINIYRPQFVEPTVVQGEALIEAIAEPTYYQETIDGQQYYVHEMRYSITPSKSGALEIAPASLITEVEVRNNPSRNSGLRSNGFRDSFFADAFFSNSMLSGMSRQRIQVSSQSVELEIAAIPSAFKAENWLPAKAVTLTEQWNNKNTVKSGQPITRTITVTAFGLSANQIPELTLPEVNGVKQYSAPGVRTQEVIDGELVSSLTTDITIIPNEAGTFTFPKINLAWWDVNEKVQKLATLAAVTQGVSGDNFHKNIGKTGQAANKAETPAPAAQDLLEPLPEKKAIIMQYVEQYWAWLLGLLVIISAALLYYFSHKKLENEVTESTLFPVDDNKSVKLTKVSKLQINSFSKACDENDPVKVRLALLSMGRVLWPAQLNFNLNLMKLLVDNEFSDEITTLNNALYNYNTNNWQGSKLKAVTLDYLKSLSQESKKTRALSPLIIESNDLSLT